MDGQWVGSAHTSYFLGAVQAAAPPHCLPHSFPPSGSQKQHTSAAYRSKHQPHRTLGQIATSKSSELLPGCITSRGRMVLHTVSGCTRTYNSHGYVCMHAILPHPHTNATQSKGQRGIEANGSMQKLCYTVPAAVAPRQPARSARTQQQAHVVVDMWGGWLVVGLRHYDVTCLLCGNGGLQQQQQHTNKGWGPGWVHGAVLVVGKVQFDLCCEQVLMRAHTLLSRPTKSIKRRRREGPLTHTHMWRSVSQPVAQESVSHAQRRPQWLAVCPAGRHRQTHFALSLSLSPASRPASQPVLWLHCQAEAEAEAERGSQVLRGCDH